MTDVRYSCISVCGLHSWPELHAVVVVEWRRVREVTGSKHIAAAGSGKPTTLTGHFGPSTLRTRGVETLRSWVRSVRYAYTTGDSFHRRTTLM